MHHRNSTSRLGVSRRKSTSSVHSKHEPIDPEVARQHAQAAASLAFTRGQERKSVDAGRPGLSRNNTTASQGQRTWQPARQDDRPVLRHQHSVRFVGPRGSGYQQSVASSRLSRSSVEPKTSSATLRPMAMTTSAPVPAAYRPPSRSSSIGKASAKGGPDSYVTASSAFNEYYTNEDDVASTPSSYRRIRKSRSMFGPIKTPSVYFTNDSPGRTETNYSAVQTPQPSPLRLRAPKSMSFLRGGRDRKRNDAAVQLARDRFFHETTQQRLREQPSFLFRTRSQNQEREFRKSVRSSSINSMPAKTSIATQSIKSIKGSKLKEKARTISRNMKDKFKRVFGRSKGPVEIPNQQVLAPETHVRDYNGDTSFPHSISNIPHPSQATLLRVASRAGSLHAANSSQTLKSQAASISSSSGPPSEKSRVTSWNNSSAVTTITSQAQRLAHTERERELQRLSVINENGTHLTAATFHRPMNQVSAYPPLPLHRPSKSAGHIPFPVQGGVDSARVYSALMKRLDESSPTAKLEASRKGSVESFINSGTPATIRHVPGSNGSSQAGSSSSNHQWIGADSIHATGAEDNPGHHDAHGHHWVQAHSACEARISNDDDVFSPKESSTSRQNCSMNHRNESFMSSATKESFYTVPEDFYMSAQDLAHRKEPVVQPMRDSRSAFFGGGQSFPVGRTPSPFRRAMALSNARPHTAPVEISQKNATQYMVTGATSFDGASEAGSGVAYSDSVYSRTTGFQTPAPEEDTLTMPPQTQNAQQTRAITPNPGNVVILNNTVYRPTGSADHRNTSSASSNDWKMWMSSEVSKLERAKQNPSPAASYINYAMPTMPNSFRGRHVRESAQIIPSTNAQTQKTVKDATEMMHDIVERRAIEEASTIQRKVSAGRKASFDSTISKQPLAVVQQNIPQLSTQNIPVLKPILKNRSTVSLVENMGPNTNENAPPIPIPPPIPTRSTLRLVPSVSKTPKNSPHPVSVTPGNGKSPNSANKVSSMSGRNMLHKRNTSSTTLKSVQSVKSATIGTTPAKLVKKNKSANNTPASYNGNGRESRTVQRQATSLRSVSRPRTPGGEWKSGTPRTNEDDPYGIEGTGLLGPRMTGGSGSDADGSASASGDGGANLVSVEQMGSKTMVDMFLSSRRRRIASESARSEDSDGVFL